jgi:CDP-diacylglycerol--glycerol-3-phosphate 3-phosphatidyltransferase
LKKHSIPWAITSLRIIASPFLIYSVNKEIRVATYPLFLFAVCTDFLDGFLAKRLKVTSKLGSYFDATADFFFVSVMYAEFILKGFYPSGILILTISVFAQFILTSLYLKRTIYDIIGKYYGSLMYGGIGLTLLFSEQLIHNIVIIGILVSSVASLCSRLAYFLRAQNRKQN